MKRKAINQTTITLFVFTVLVSVLCFHGSFAHGQEWTAAQKEVWKAVETDWELLKRGDLDGLMAMRHANAIIWWPSKMWPFGGKSMKREYKGWLDYDPPVAYELEPLDIQIIGNVSIVFYESKWNGNLLSGYGRFMETWIKQDNKWLKIGSFSASCEKLPPCKKTYAK